MRMLIIIVVLVTFLLLLPVVMRADGSRLPADLADRQLTAGGSGTNRADWLPYGRNYNWGSAR